MNGKIYSSPEKVLSNACLVGNLLCVLEDPREL